MNEQGECRVRRPPGRHVEQRDELQGHGGATTAPSSNPVNPHHRRRRADRRDRPPPRPRHQTKQGPEHAHGQRCVFRLRFDSAFQQRLRRRKRRLISPGACLNLNTAFPVQRTARSFTGNPAQHSGKHAREDGAKPNSQGVCWDLVRPPRQSSRGDSAGSGSHCFDWGPFCGFSRGMKVPWPVFSTSHHRPLIDKQEGPPQPQRRQHAMAFLL